MEEQLEQRSTERQKQHKSNVALLGGLTLLSLPLVLIGGIIGLAKGLETVSDSLKNNCSKGNEVKSDTEMDTRRT
jgi:hypothetical protein